MQAFQLALTVILSAACLFSQTSEASLRAAFEQGEKALAEGRFRDAEQVYQNLLKAAPNVAEVNGRLGLVYFEEKRFEEAVPVLRQALKLKPSLPNTDVLLAMSLAEIGRYAEALPALEKGFRHTSDPALKRMSGLQLLRAYTGLARDDNAVATALDLNRFFPNDPEILYHTSKIYGNFAFLKLQKLAEVAPDSIWRHQATGEAYESAGNFDLATAEYRRVLAQDPGRHGIHYRIGRVLLSRSRSGASESQLEALSEFEQELALDPTNANAAYEAGEICRRSGQLEKSRDLFTKALDYYPSFEEAQLGLAAVLVSLGQPAMALPHVQEAIAHRSDDEVAYYRLAMTYKALGNESEQRKAFERYRQLRSQKAAHTIDGNLQKTDVTRQEIDDSGAQ